MVLCVVCSLTSCTLCGIACVNQLLRLGYCSIRPSLVCYFDKVFRDLSLVLAFVFSWSQAHGYIEKSFHLVKPFDESAEIWIRLKNEDRCKVEKITKLATSFCYTVSRRSCVCGAWSDAFYTIGRWNWKGTSDCIHFGKNCSFWFIFPKKLDGPEKLGNRPTWSLSLKISQTCCGGIWRPNLASF